MNNNAFKDLVRSHGGKKSSSTSSKAIARKAVEEEFRKKKRKRSGDGSSSEEDDDNNYNKKIGRRKRPEENGPADDDGDDDAEAIQKDLSSRYRDRAKERREGKVADNTADDNTAGAGDINASNSLFIMPRSVKGLDLALARRERLELQTKKSAGGHSSSTGLEGDKDGKEIRDKIPTSDQAQKILQAFVSRGTDKTIDDSYDENSLPTMLSDGLVDYIKEMLSWKALDISTWEGGHTTGANVSNSLQNTKFSMAIDGNPSDVSRAWEIPRQYTLSKGIGGVGGLSSSPALLSADVMNRVDAVFRYQNSIREKMMERQTPNVGNRSASVNSDAKTQPTAGKDGSDDESDEDMFA
jgi:hypothetical protein